MIGIVNPLPPNIQQVAQMLLQQAEAQTLKEISIYPFQTNHTSCTPLITSKDESNQVQAKKIHHQRGVILIYLTE